MENHMPERPDPFAENGPKPLISVIPHYTFGVGEAEVKVFISDAMASDDWRSNLDVERTRALLQDAIVNLCMGDMGGAVDAAGEALARMALFSAPRGTS